MSGASPAYNIEEMTYALKTADAKFLMTAPSSIQVAIAAAKNAGIPQQRIFLLEGEMDGFTSIKELIAIGKSYGEQGQIKAFKIPRGKKNKDVCGFLSFSSGTTGLPKAVRVTVREKKDFSLPNTETESQVMIAHQNVIAQCLQIQQITPPDLERILAVLPVFHSRRAPPLIIQSTSN